MIPEATILWSVAIPLIGSLGILLTGKSPNLRETITLATATTMFLMIGSLTHLVLGGERPSISLIEVFPGIDIEFMVEPLGLLFALIASGLWIVTSLYAIGYMRAHKEDNQTRFYIFFAIALSSAVGVAFAGNLFTLFLFYEALTLSTFPLVTHHGTPEAKRCGRTYLGILLGTSIGFLLLAIICTWHLTGTLEFRPGGILAGKVEGPMVSVLLFLYMYGTGKAALMPIHRWLPAAMIAPTPVSALLHAVAVVKAGVFTVLKIIIYIFGIDFLSASGSNIWLMWVAAATLLFAAIVAMRKNNLKARLAYSTVSQLSYIVLGAALATGTSVIGGGLHLAMHAFGKITLFFCAGAIFVAAQKTLVSELDGIGRRMPFTMGAFVIGSLSIIGLPPMGGAWSKFHLMLGAASAEYYIFIAVWALSSLLSAAYLMPVISRAFFLPLSKSIGAAATGGIVLQEAPIFSLIAIGITSAGTFILFFFAGDIANMLAPIVMSKN